MGTITTTKRAMNDDLDFARVLTWLEDANDEARDTLAKKLRVQAEFRFDLSIGGFRGSSATHYLREADGASQDPAGHPALDHTDQVTYASEAVAFQTLIAKIYNHGADNDDLAGG